MTAQNETSMNLTSLVKEETIPESEIIPQILEQLGALGLNKEQLSAMLAEGSSLFESLLQNIKELSKKDVATLFKKNGQRFQLVSLLGLVLVAGGCSTIERAAENGIKLVDDIKNVTTDVIKAPFEVLGRGLETTEAWAQYLKILGEYNNQNPGYKFDRKEFMPIYVAYYDMVKNTPNLDTEAFLNFLPTLLTSFNPTHPAGLSQEARASELIHDLENYMVQFNK